MQRFKLPPIQIVDNVTLTINTPKKVTLLTKWVVVEWNQ
jgi:hypothetical protein